MTIEERIAEAEALNQKLRGLVSHSVPQTRQSPIMRKAGKPFDPTIEPNLCSYDWLAQVKPSFKSFCERTLVGVTPSMAEILERHRKATNSAIRSAMKPKGINSLLGPYQTGRLVKSGEVKHAYEYEETLKIIRVSKDEWSSTEPDPEVVAVPQNVPALGQELPKPAETDDEEPENPAQDEQNEPRPNAEALARVIAALELQNALMGQILSRKGISA